MCVLHYDGSFEGFLTLVFETVSKKIIPENIICSMEERKYGRQLSLDAETFIDTDLEKAFRVYRGIVAYSSRANASMIAVAFRSSDKGKDMLIWRYLEKMFVYRSKDFFRNGLDDDVFQLHSIAKRVKQEVHRFQGFVRFQEAETSLMVAAIEPDHDIVGLLGTHFKNRFPGREWIIFDTRRRQGIWFDQKEIQLVVFDKGLPLDSNHSLKQHIRSDREDQYRELWKCYYESVNIAQRVNKGQMLRMMPRRYWKYLPEKDN